MLFHRSFFILLTHQRRSSHLEITLTNYYPVESERPIKFVYGNISPFFLSLFSLSSLSFSFYLLSFSLSLQPPPPFSLPLPFFLSLSPSPDFPSFPLSLYSIFFSLFLPTLPINLSFVVNKHMHCTTTPLVITVRLFLQSSYTVTLLKP